jgi:hypothetical protein
VWGVKSGCILALRMRMVDEVLTILGKDVVSESEQVQ